MDIAATPAQVWAALCDPAKVPLWLGLDAKVKPRTGGTWVATVAPGLLREAMIDVFEPPRRLRLIYLPPPDLSPAEGAVVDDFLLDSEGESTILRMLCSGVPEASDWTQLFTKVRATSERALSRLKLVVEREGATAGSSAP